MADTARQDGHLPRPPLRARHGPRAPLGGPPDRGPARHDRARRPVEGQGAERTEPRLAVVVPDGDLRLVRDAHQRATPAGLQHADRRAEQRRRGGRPAPQLRHRQGPGPRPAPRCSRRTASCCRTSSATTSPSRTTRPGSTGSRPTSWSSTSSSATASSAAAAWPPARRWPPTRSTPGRCRSARPTATTATRATAGFAARREVLSGGSGPWRCHFAGECSQVCPKGVDPAKAIQLMKRELVSDLLRLRRRRAPAAVAEAPHGTPREGIAAPPARTVTPD